MIRAARVVACNELDLHCGDAPHRLSLGPVRFLYLNDLPMYAFRHSDTPFSGPDTPQLLHSKEWVSLSSFSADLYSPGPYIFVQRQASGLRKIRLRTKFLLSLLAISAGLTSATLFIVGYRVQKRVRDDIRQDLQTSVNTYQSFDRQRQQTLSRSAQLLANQPNVRALMTTRDANTIQDASADVWRLGGSDLLVMADRSGTVLALRSNAAGFARDAAQKLMSRSLEKGETRDWWFDGGHLFEIWVQPIYFGASSEGATLGFLAVGQEVQARAAKDFGSIAGSDVAFYYGDALVATTLDPAQQSALTGSIHAKAGNSSSTAHELQLGSERFLVTTVVLSSEKVPAVSLAILKSLDRATSFLDNLYRVLLGLGLLSILAGSALVFVISDTFTRPLANLVGGVHALEKGDFTYALEGNSGDEVAEVTAAFDRMRATLQSSQREQAQLEERLRQAHKMEAVGRLAGGVAHDFNNLLTIIRGHGDLLSDRPGLVDAERRSLEQIRKASSKAVAMTRQLLAFSRMQVLQPRVLDLNAVVSDMGKMLPRLIGEHIEYAFLPEAKLAPVKADPGQIEQVIMNLVVNSRDAMPNGGKITVRSSNVVMDEAEARLHPPMTAGNYVLLSVSDTGHGMSPETKAHIFEPFFTTKEVGKGTGLGLATVYGVVKQSGGFVWVESAPGKGATFEIYLPQTSGKALAPSDTESRLTPIPRGSETILVVEDEDDVRDLTCEFLKVSGYSVLGAPNGLAALELLSRYSGKVHLVLSDVIMPRMGGTELAERLRVVRPETKILLMSGYSEYSNGAKDPGLAQLPILQKPFSRPSVVKRVREALSEQPVEPAESVKGT
jgi:signal transduction histidine kinase